MSNGTDAIPRKAHPLQLQGRDKGGKENFRQKTEEDKTQC